MGESLFKFLTHTYFVYFRYCLYAQPERYSVLAASKENERINEWLVLIGSMSQYLHDLSEWEVIVQDFDFSRCQGEEKFAIALDIFELGCYNMYGQFNMKRTLAEYRNLIHRMEKAGVQDLSSDVDLSKW